MYPQFPLHPMMVLPVIFLRNRQANITCQQLLWVIKEIGENIYIAVALTMKVPFFKNFFRPFGLFSENRECWLDFYGSHYFSF